MAAAPIESFVNQSGDKLVLIAPCGPDRLRPAAQGLLARAEARREYMADVNGAAIDRRLEARPFLPAPAEEHMRALCVPSTEGALADEI